MQALAFVLILNIPVVPASHVGRLFHTDIYEQHACKIVLSVLKPVGVRFFI